jgi:diguanylate cyclase (GGDEF)-like protein
LPIHAKAFWICSVCCGVVVGIGSLLAAWMHAPLHPFDIALISLNGITVAWGCLFALRRPAQEMWQKVRKTRQGHGGHRIVMRTQDCFAQLAGEINQVLQRYDNMSQQVRSLEGMLRDAQDQLNNEFSRREQIATLRSRELSAVSELAIKDELTGLANRREALNRLRLFWESTQMYADPLACILLDIDHFKSFNDQYGHASGDLVLQKTADTLRRNVRDNDVVCRFGGEEFVILCPHGGLDGASACAEHLRKAVERQNVNWEDKPLHITASLGVAIRADAMRNAEDLIRQADQGLYRAKHSGRNRVVSVPVFDEGPSQHQLNAETDPVPPVRAEPTPVPSAAQPIQSPAPAAPVAAVAPATPVASVARPGPASDRPLLRFSDE